MPIFKTGNMWDAYDDADLFLITTNSMVKSSGALVMGAGIAKEAKEKFPGIEFTLGNEILKTCGQLGKYCLLISPQWPDKKLGCFQVKYHWKDNADIDLIADTSERLFYFLEAYDVKNCHLNFPGIGNGRLDRELVLNVLIPLGNNVTIWEKV